MNKFLNYIGYLSKQSKLNKAQLYLSIFGILLFLGLAISLPLINGQYNKDQHITNSYAAAPAGYNLAWSDEFDIVSLDLSCNGSGNWADKFCGWNTRRLFDNSDDGVKMNNDWKGINPPADAKTIQQVLTEASWQSPSLHEASIGTLKLRAYPIPPAYQTQFDWYGATNPSAASMISGEKSHAQTYGYWEVRAKLNAEPKNKHFSIWLLPVDGDHPPEIDLLETLIDINNQGRGVLSAANSHGESPNVDQTFFSPEGGMLNVWHTYGFEWTPTTMTWTVDGQVVRSHPNYVNKPMYFLASWEVGGDWSGNTDENTNWPGEFEIDYVRVYSGIHTPTATPIPTGTITIDDRATGTGLNQFNYSSGWESCTNCGAELYNGTNTWSTAASATATVNFSGTQFKFYGVVGTNHGIGAVSIDNGAETLIDQYAASREGNKLLWTSPVLPPGNHTFKLRVTGTKNSTSTNYYVVADRADIISSSAPTNTPTPTSVPPTATPTNTPSPTPTPTNTPTPTPTNTPSPTPTTNPGITTIFSDNFDSVLNWTKSGSVTWYTGSPRNGTHSVRLSSTGYIQKAVSLAGYQNISVSFNMGATSLESTSEYIRAFYYNGSSWVELTRITNGSVNENNLLNPYTFTLPSTINNLSSFQLRFQFAGDRKDFGFVDDVKVRGTSI